MERNYASVIINTLRNKLLNTPMDKINVADICRDANISRQSFYYHFTGINDCLYQMFLDDFNEFRNKIPEITKLNSIRELLDQFYSYVYNNQKIIKNIFAASEKVVFFNYLYNTMMAYIRRTIPKFVPEAQLLPYDDLNYIIEFYISCFLTSIINWVNKDFSTTPDFEAVHFQIITAGSLRDWVRKFIEFNRRKAITTANGEKGN